MSRLTSEARPWTPGRRLAAWPARTLNLLLALALSGCALVTPTTATKPSPADTPVTVPRATPVVVPTRIATASPEPAPTEKPAQPDILAILSMESSFQQFLALLERGDGVEALKSGSLTLFAPTNEAIGKLAENGMEGLQEQPAQLHALLLYHVAEGRLTGDQLAARSDLHPISDGRATVPLRTLQGATATVLLNERTVEKVNNARVGRPIEALNGIIYPVDTVLLPVAPPEPPRPGDLDPSYEAWVPYPPDAPMPIGDAELVPGAPLMTQAVKTLAGPLIASRSPINLARTVRLTAEGETVYVAPVAPSETAYSSALPSARLAAQVPSPVLGAMDIEGPASFQLRPGAYVLRAARRGQGWAVEFLDASGNVAGEMPIIVESGLPVQDPSAAIFYGSVAIVIRAFGGCWCLGTADQCRGKCP